MKVGNTTVTSRHFLRRLLTVDVVSAAGASRPKEATVSFTEGVDVCRANQEAQLKINNICHLLGIGRNNVRPK